MKKRINGLFELNSYQVRLRSNSSSQIVMDRLVQMTRIPANNLKIEKSYYDGIIHMQMQSSLGYKKKYLNYFMPDISVDIHETMDGSAIEMGFRLKNDIAKLLETYTKVVAVFFLLLLLNWAYGLAMYGAMASDILIPIEYFLFHYIGIPHILKKNSKRVLRLVGSTIYDEEVIEIPKLNRMQ